MLCIEDYCPGYEVSINPLPMNRTLRMFLYSTIILQHYCCHRPASVSSSMFRAFYGVIHQNVSNIYRLNRSYKNWVCHEGPNAIFECWVRKPFHRFNLPMKGKLTQCSRVFNHYFFCLLLRPELFTGTAFDLLDRIPIWNLQQFLRYSPHYTVSFVISQWFQIGESNRNMFRHLWFSGVLRRSLKYEYHTV